MPSDRTVLEHLLEGRDALVLEVKRLTTAIDELDSVIARIGGGDRRTPAEPGEAAAVQTATPEPVNSPVEVEAAAAEPAVPTPAPAKKTPARKAPATRNAAQAAPPRARKSAAKSASRPPTTEAPKSIRVHVLEMLAAENRDFGLAEIIDRIHSEGIQAHDDAVRSITIKLMKDGRVERVGRGLYRLAGRAAAAPAPEPAAEAYVPPLDLGQSWQRPGT